MEPGVGKGSIIAFENKNKPADQQFLTHFNDEFTDTTNILAEPFGTLLQLISFLVLGCSITKGVVLPNTEIPKRILAMFKTHIRQYLEKCFKETQTINVVLFNNRVLILPAWTSEAAT